MQNLNTRRQLLIGSKLGCCSAKGELNNGLGSKTWKPASRFYHGSQPAASPLKICCLSLPCISKCRKQSEGARYSSLHVPFSAWRKPLVWRAQSSPFSTFR